MTRAFERPARVLAACAALLLALSLAAAAEMPEPPQPTPETFPGETGAPPPAAPAPAAAPEPAAVPAEPLAPAQATAPTPTAAPAWRPPTVARRERGSLVLDNIPEIDPQLGARLGRYLDSRQAQLLDWMPDGSLLITTRFGETEQVHRVAAPQRDRAELTFFPEPVTVARAAPVGGGFVFLKDQGGDENAQVFYRSPDGAVRQLTHGAFRHGSPVWAHDGKRVAFYGNDRDGVSYDVYVTDVTSGAAPQLVVGGKPETWYPLDWSADDGKLLVMRYVSVSESYLSLANVETGALTPLDPGAHKSGIRAARFAPDGRGVYVLSDEEGEFARVRLVDPVNHASRAVTPELEWDVEAFDVSADGRFLAYVVNEDGRSALRILELTSRTELPPPALPEGIITRLSFERAAPRLALSLESAQAPRDVYSYDLASARLERWTQSEPGGVDTRTFVVPELVRFPTWDRVAGHQRLLSAYVYRPRTGASCPVVIDIHGGPEAQFRPGWDPFIQFLVNELGYAVIAPNVRGSTGYGKSFTELDNGELREDAVRDVGSLLVWIGAQPAFDRGHVAVMGASYGGYMALASLIAYGERLRGGIDVVGISNFVSFLRTTAPYRREQRRAEYGDERDPRMRDFLERISPLTNASRIKKPLLVVEGQNDPRVPGSESEQLVWRVRSAGGDVWYLLARDEGHGFRKKANRDAYLETAATFLETLKH